MSAPQCRVGERHYTCTLDASTLQKAQRELGEDPDTRLLEVKQLAQRLNKVPGLKAKTDARFLLSFLRARKFDQERTFEMVTHHYREKFEHPEHYDDLKPSLVKHVIEDRVMEVLEHRDLQGCRVIVIRAGLNWDPARYSITPLIKLFFLILYKLSQEEETQVHGVRVIDNLKDLTLRHNAQFTPSASRFVTSALQNMVPIRLKRYDFVNQPIFMDIILPVFKSFMKDKLVQRIHVHGVKYDELHKTISPDCLPWDLGGTQEPHSYSKGWMSELLASEKEFEDDNKFGFLNMGLENRKSETSQQDAGLQGLGGTFKKLEV